MIKTERFINGSMLESARRWLEYKPKEWNLEELYSKKASDLSKGELEILLQVKRDELLMSYYHRLYELLVIYGANVYMSLEDEEKLDVLFSYVRNHEYESKIPQSTKEYVEVLLNELMQDEVDDVSSLIEAIANIQDECIREYANREWKKRVCLRDALKTTANAGKLSRKKPPLSATIRVPNRFR